MSRFSPSGVIHKFYGRPLVPAMGKLAQADVAALRRVLEDINITDARGVQINISASKASFQLQEMYDVMETIKAFAAESATVIVGTVYDEAIEDNLRVTIVATGLGKPMSRQQMKPMMVVTQKTDTDNQPMEVNYSELEQPAVIRRRNRDTTVEAMRQSGVEMLDIPAFLRKQAD